ncbi:hypothetical protein SAMN05443574_106252 [Haloarcula vallismortis]|uniref:Hsp20/alpha crystallin family protein n=2 Tax=Haloarcula vallismortis TaxID=28442 RepID=M0JHT6_HALVA|nr:hypothetical protein [Haloarcula vallismortis]EMA07554.1 hypothetical protein C437_08918 [Haloarcula vallismortis ATCC 29715]SDW77722.1 hypothetical protein SAMN05443574_106252 [Haloarcula vallismortis]
MDAQTERSPLHVSHTDHDDSWTVAVDLGSLQVSDDHVTVDVIGTEAIVAVDAPHLQTEFDIELPAAGAVQTLRNGVLTLSQRS